MGAPAEAARCPDCGTELLSDGAIEGLCPQCLLSLALLDSSGDLKELETLDGPAPGRILGGRILGERCRASPAPIDAKTLSRG